MSPTRLQERRVDLNRDWIQGHPCQRLKFSPSAVLDADFDTHMPGVNSPVSVKRKALPVKDVSMSPNRSSSESSSSVSTFQSASNSASSAVTSSASVALAHDLSEIFLTPAEELVMQRLYATKIHTICKEITRVSIPRRYVRNTHGLLHAHLLKLTISRGFMHILVPVLQPSPCSIDSI